MSVQPSLSEKCMIPPLWVSNSKREETECNWSKSLQVIWPIRKSNLRSLIRNILLSWCLLHLLQYITKTTISRTIHLLLAPFSNFGSTLLAPLICRFFYPSSSASRLILKVLKLSQTLQESQHFRNSNELDLSSLLNYRIHGIFHFFIVMELFTSTTTSYCSHVSLHPTSSLVHGGFPKHTLSTPKETRGTPRPYPIMPEKAKAGNLRHRLVHHSHSDILITVHTREHNRHEQESYVTLLQLLK